jgi:UDP-N-acetylglucosamine--N-acetylmuramyl-(pentapeptide) pyrophosphoryl-undecaprenol N-acetylglucosamine transferase
MNNGQLIMNKYRNLKKITILCGGTGGHFFPGLSIAREFAKSGCKTCLITGGHKKDYQREAAARNSIDFFEVSSSKLSKKPIGLIKFSVSLMKGYFQSIKIFKQFKPDAVIGMGSFTNSTKKKWLT